jgi:tetratricopeptide (TPR) repeat protein
MMGRWLLAMVVVAVLGGPLVAFDDPIATFKQANEAYRAKEFDRAASLYRSLAERVRSPDIFYNWGNAAYKAGRLGEAILALEKAHRLSPRDRDVKSNLAFLRTRVTDSIREEEGDFVTRFFFYLIDHLSLNELAAASSILLWISVLIAMLMIVNRNPGRSGAIRAALVLAMVLMAIALVPGLVKLYLEEAHREAVVLVREIDVLSGPAPDELKRFSLHEGTKVRILKEWDRWVQISLPNGENGWALAERIGAL